MDLDIQVQGEGAMFLKEGGYVFEGGGLEGWVWSDWLFWLIRLYVYVFVYVCARLLRWRSLACNTSNTHMRARGHTCVRLLVCWRL